MNKQSLLTVAFCLLAAMGVFAQGTNEGMTQKCATPIISVEDGTIKFHCQTEGVSYVSEITNNDVGKKSTDEVNLKGKITVTVYATKEGYQDSDTATAEFTAAGGKIGDLNSDGEVTVTDALIIMDMVPKNEE